MAIEAEVWGQHHILSPLQQVADIISVAVFRELGPLVAAIVLTGFAGASIAAEMGTMVVSEEIEGYVYASGA